MQCQKLELSKTFGKLKLLEGEVRQQQVKKTLNKDQTPDHPDQNFHQIFLNKGPARRFTVPRV